MISMRKFSQSDWPQVWAILKPVLRAGNTYSFSIDITEAEAKYAWQEGVNATYVAEDASGSIVGTYYIKTNQPGQGSHICNCGYIVDSSARGQGIASTMCEHSQARAIELGFRAMQYNLVVATNTGAVRLWEKHGFNIVGEIPDAFNHPEQGFVNAYIMYKEL